MIKWIEKVASTANIVGAILFHILSRSESNNGGRGDGKRWSNIVAIGLSPPTDDQLRRGAIRTKRERSGGGLSSGAGLWCLMVVGGWTAGSCWWRRGADLGVCRFNGAAGWRTATAALGSPTSREVVAR
ncbi:hypothetical protein FXO38_21703 [Capsicum annuum]|nr:hypothetical protein FXO37_24155 [Capsicum annuum]KAF3641277.1 hypothetical protein FXO38_21703 [Capsicum annuum]